MSDIVLFCKAIVIQRAFRKWKDTAPEGTMHGIIASNDVEATMAMIERDGQSMANKYERSRNTKIALKKTIIKRTQHIKHMEKQLESEVCDSTGRPIAESIFADLLTRFPGIMMKEHPEFMVRLEMYSHAFKHSDLFPLPWDGKGSMPMAEVDVECLFEIDANVGPKRIRQAIENALQGLLYSHGPNTKGFIDRHCFGIDYPAMFKGCRFVYDGIEPWMDVEDEGDFRFYVCWTA
eukprot:COSAG06_NODE_4826_length_3926_cov_6.183172_3_plen_235_part_00